MTSPHDARALAAAILIRHAQATEAGEAPDFETWLEGQPELVARPEVAEYVRWMYLLAPGASSAGGSAEHLFRSGDDSNRESDSDAPQPLCAGALLGDFRLIRFIARGGMGQVWEAEQESLRRRVALKLVLPERVDARSLELFAREARAGGRLHHAHVVETISHGGSGDLAWIAQELIEGSRTLKHLIDDTRAKDELPPGYYPAVAALVANLADALEAAHVAGVVHRDVKPQNILITPEGQPKLTDFGLARLTDETALSRTGDFAGTYLYMSPEQVTARRVGIDHRTDIFSLGVVFYELLTLRRPFDGDTTQQVCQQIVFEEPPPVRSVRSQCPEELVVICGKAMEKNAATRYASMADFAADLRRHLTHEPILARPPGPLSRAAKWTRRHPAVSSAAAVTLLALIVVSGLLIAIVRQKQDIEQQKDLALANAELARERADRIAYREAGGQVRRALSFIESGDTAAAEELLEACPEGYSETWEWQWARNQLDSRPLVLDGVSSAAFSPDGTRIVSTSRGEHVARVWDTKTGVQLAVLEGHEGSLSQAIFSPDGLRIATVSLDETARVWDMETSVVLAVLELYVRAVEWARFSSDGTRLVTGSRNGAVGVWEAETGVRVGIAVYEGNASEAGAVFFGGDGTRIVTTANDGMARIVDLDDRVVLAVLRGHTRRVQSAIFSPDGTRVVTAAYDNTARVWDADTGANLAVLRGHERWLKSATFSPDGTRIVTASREGTACVWDAETGAKLAVLRGHKDAVVSACFSPDGARIVTASEDTTARVWDAETGVMLTLLGGYTSGLKSAVFSPDGERVLTTSLDETAHVWEEDTEFNPTVFVGPAGAVRSAHFSSDGERVVTVFGDGTASVWDPATGLSLTHIRVHGVSLDSARFSDDGTRIVTAGGDSLARVWDAQTGRRLAVLRGHVNGVSSAHFSPNGTRIVTASVDDTARIWNANTGAELAVLERHTDRVLSARFSPDGTRVVTVSRDGTARVWDPDADVSLAVLSDEVFLLESAQFSPDCTHIVTIVGDDTARVWDAETGQGLAVLRGHSDEVLSALFSPDGTRIVTASADGTAWVWDTRTEVVVAVLRGHTEDVNWAQFSPDGTRVVTASRDGTTRVWDPDTGANLVVLKGHAGPVLSARFSPDGTRIVSASRDGTAWVWDASPRGTRTGSRWALFEALDPMGEVVRRRLGEGEHPLDLRQSMLRDPLMTAAEVRAGLAAEVVVQDRVAGLVDSYFDEEIFLGPALAGIERAPSLPKWDRTAALAMAADRGEPTVEELEEIIEALAMAAESIAGVEGPELVRMLRLAQTSVVLYPDDGMLRMFLAYALMKNGDWDAALMTGQAGLEMVDEEDLSMAQEGMDELREMIRMERAAASPEGSEED